MLSIVFLLVSILHLFLAFKKDRLLWCITIGNRIDIEKAHRLKRVAFESTGPFYSDHNIDILDIRYFLCDGLRRDIPIKLNSVKSLLGVFPDYMNIHDRDGMSPFELACQFASVDLVQYMVEIDEKSICYVDDRGNTPLHWACQSGRTYLSIKVVNYLLEKQMSLVTVANKDGDLPIHVASDNVKELNVIDYSSKQRRGSSRVTPMQRYSEYRRASEPQRIEIVLRLLLAYPDCLNCVGGEISDSNE